MGSADMSALSVLISTYWNVNDTSPIFVVTKPFVLISTYWNVNVKSYANTLPVIVVLISTYWNVNQDIQTLISKRIGGFNLNLLECKSNLEMVEQQYADAF